MSEWMNDVKTAYKKLKKYAKDIFVIGNSMGGNLAFELAREMPIKGLVAVSTPVFLRSHFFIQTFFPYLKPIIRFYKKSGASEHLGKERTILGNGFSYSRIPTKALGELLELMREQRKHSFGSLDAPCLIMHSINDGIVDPRSASFIFEKVKSKKKLLWLSEPRHSIIIGGSKFNVFEEIYQFIVQNSS